jgi:hypothetical protein
VIVEATVSGLLQALWNVVVWILVVLAEIFVTALIVAPRALIRKLRSALHAPFERMQRGLGALAPRREPPRPSREGS